MTGRIDSTTLVYPERFRLTDFQSLFSITSYRLPHVILCSCFHVVLNMSLKTILPAFCAIAISAQLQGVSVATNEPHHI